MKAILVVIWMVILAAAVSVAFLLGHSRPEATASTERIVVEDGAEAAIIKVDDQTWRLSPVGLVVTFQLPRKPGANDIIHVELTGSRVWSIIGVARYAQDGEQPQTATKSNRVWDVALNDENNDRIEVTLWKDKDAKFEPWQLMAYLGRRK